MEILAGYFSYCTIIGLYSVTGFAMTIEMVTIFKDLLRFKSI